MFIGGIVDSPKFFQRKRLAAVQVRRSLIDTIELRNIDEAGSVVLIGGAHIKTGFGGEVGCGRMASVAVLLVIDSLSALLRWRKFATGGQMAVRGQRDGLDERNEIGEFFLVESLRVEKEFGDARATLRFEVRIVAVPFVRRSLRDAAKSAIGHAVAAELRSFQVPSDAIDVIVWMAGDAGKLALKTETSGVKKLFAATELRGFLRAAEIDGSTHAHLPDVDDGEAVVQAIDDICRETVRSDHHGGWVRSGGNPPLNDFSGRIEAIGELCDGNFAEPLLQLCGINLGNDVGLGRGDEGVASIGSESNTVGAGVVVVDIVKKDLRGFGRTCVVLNWRQPPDE